MISLASKALTKSIKCYPGISCIIGCNYNSNMVKVLNVAEKNDAAKNLASIMSNNGFKRREGYSKFNKIYEFEFMLMNRKSLMVMTSVSGHLLNYDFVGSYRKWSGCNPVSLFEAPIEKFCPSNYVDIKRTLEKEARYVQSLVIWTDGDREGENIGFEIIKVCQAVNPSLKIFRAKFSDLTRQSVMRACNSLIQPDIRTSDAVDVRQELDLRIGAAFTRFQTMRLKKVFPNHLADQLISYGSCQFPTLGFVVERYKQVMSFVPESFWKIKVTHNREGEDVEFSWKRGRLFVQQACFVIFEKCLESPSATVTEVKSKSKSKWRPLPLDTVELEKLASKKLRINAKETMQMAEKLYTSGFISYPRTETNIFPKELDLVNLVQMQTQDNEWGEFARRIIDRGGPNPRRGTKNDEAHPPIHPTKYTSNLNGNEKRLYEFIVRHFLACCSQNAEGHETTVDIEIVEEQFSTNGLMIIARNYLDVYPYDRWNAKLLPIYTNGETFTPTNISMPEGETSPPSLLTEADLISLMEKHGIGTDATHADHIETIKSRMYVGVRDDGRFVPGELGMGLVEGYDLMGFEMSKPNLRAEFEADLKRICEGQKFPDVVRREQIQKYKEVFVNSTLQAHKLDEALSQYLGEPMQTTSEDFQSETVVKPCAKCGMDMSLKTRQEGRGFYVGCMAYPQCKSSIWFPNYVEDVKIDSETCPTCGPTVRLLQFKFRRSSMQPYYPDQYTGCIGGCDSRLLESLGIVPAGVITVTSEVEVNRSNDQRQPTVSSRSDGRVSGARVNPADATQSGRRSMSTDSGYNSHNFPSSVATFRDGNGSRRNGSFDTPVLTPASSLLSANFQRSSSPSSYQNRTPLNSIQDQNNDVTLVCNCGEDAILLTVKKPGKNQGRRFYKCVKRDAACNFFQFADDDENSASADSFQTDDVRCNCRQNAALLTVQKDGPNKGRQFYSCPKPMNKKCAFFKWSDENDGTVGNQQRFDDSSRPGPSGLQRNAGDATRKRKCAICRLEGHTRTTCPQR